MKLRSNFREFIVCGTLLVAPAMLSAQSSSSAARAPRNIFDALSADVPGEGRVTINQSDEIKRRVGVISSRYGAVLGKDGNVTLMMGYRIQFYNGNLMTAKAEAESRARVLRTMAPEYSTYVSYNAPFWRLAVGDFATMQEARQARNRLVGMLPAWAKEGHVVRDKVRILNFTPDTDAN